MTCKRGEGDFKSAISASLTFCSLTCYFSGVSIARLWVMSTNNYIFYNSFTTNIGQSFVNITFGNRIVLECIGVHCPKV